MNEDIKHYNEALTETEKNICDLLETTISSHLPGSINKIWHRHPVWFLEENPIVGYSKEKKGIRLMFWSGADFEEKSLNVVGGKFKDASIFYNEIAELNTEDVIRWINKSKLIQWDYKNIVKNKGKLYLKNSQ